MDHQGQAMPMDHQGQAVPMDYRGQAASMNHQGQDSRMSPRLKSKTQPPSNPRLHRGHYVLSTNCP